MRGIKVKYRYWYASHRTQGGVMAEAVLIMPLILIIFALVIFFGMSMLRSERSSIMDRYVVWRNTQLAPGPVDESDLNRAFMGDNAASIEFDVYSDPPMRPTMIMRDAAAEESDTTRQYVEEQIALFPDQQMFVFKTSHDSNVPLYRWMGTWNRHGHQRVENEWKYMNSSVLNEYDKWTYGFPRVSLEVLQTNFFIKWYDDGLVAESERGNEFATIFRSFHFASPGYGGIMVTPNDWNSY